MAGEKGRRLSAVLAIPGESPKQQKQDDESRIEDITEVHATDSHWRLMMA